MVSRVVTLRLMIGVLIASNKRQLLLLFCLLFVCLFVLFFDFVLFCFVFLFTENVSITLHFLFVKCVIKKSLLHIYSMIMCT